VQNFSQDKQRRAKDISFILSYLGFLMISAGIVLLLIPALPWVYYRINGEATADEVEIITGFVGIGGDSPLIPDPLIKPPPKPVFALPKYDASLPKTNTLRISKLGVNGPINEGTNAKKLLYRGIWRVPEFGNPFKNQNPIILAAHRYGYINWSATFRKTNSFANLPSLKKGDTFQIIWNQRAFKYKVYDTEENTGLTDYSADVIMYTCKYLKSPVRIVVYARRVE